MGRKEKGAVDPLLFYFQASVPRLLPLGGIVLECRSGNLLRYDF
jgi:hypothetical protein